MAPYTIPPIYFTPEILMMKDTQVQSYKVYATIRLRHTIKVLVDSNMGTGTFTLIDNYKNNSDLMIY